MTVSSSTTSLGRSSEFGVTTIMMILLFGTNFFIFLLFQFLKFYTSTSNRISSNSNLQVQDNCKKGGNKVAVVEKELSKPFTGTVECYVNLTSEMFKLGLLMMLTYVCEKHWIFDHSGKSYSRDLFLFVLIVFFGYAFYTIKPCHDLTLLSREQTEEWKGWMQFIFLLYHYFHAEEVYNSVRVMITCYVWMTGFGNFSFFYMKQDFGWLRVVQMLWRLNFSVLFLMWTHGNTYILYYICPMHTFYFLLVYVFMYVYPHLNHSKWGIRFKLLALAAIIYVVWDINNGIFDFVFGWLGTESVVGASRGSVWEYYFRTSLDHWSSFLGMIFALNFPLAEQYFHKARGYPLVVCSVLMFAATVYWFYNYYMLDKLVYNLSHAYMSIIPLTSYIFFRNLTPFIRSGVSMSLHDLGKTTLETYLLQHHIWLTSNAKTLLTIVPGHPWINFALATILFFVCSKELYRLTMSLRGMLLPDDKSLAWVNIIGMSIVVFILYFMATILYAMDASLLTIVITCCLLFLCTLFVISRMSKTTAESSSYQSLSSKYTLVVSAFVALATVYGIVSGLFTVNTSAASNYAIASQLQSYRGNSPQCLRAISNGHWESIRCNEAASAVKSAYCQTDKWVWDLPADGRCPIAKVATDRARYYLKGKSVVFAGDSIVRNVYHQFISALDPTYSSLNYSSAFKHHDMTFSIGASSTNITFLWAPFLSNATAQIKAYNKKVDLLVSGAAAWDALYIRDVGAYSQALLALAQPQQQQPVPSKNTINVWIQPTTIIDGRLSSQEKHVYMNEAAVKKYRRH